MVYREQIIHLDLPGDYGWPDNISSIKNQKERMLAIIERGVKNNQDLNLPITQKKSSLLKINFPLLYYAVEEDKLVDVTKKLLEYGMDLKRRYGIWETSILGHAVSSCSVENVKLLLDVGIDAASIRDGGETLLHIISGYGGISCNPIDKRCAIMKLLLEHGADPNARDLEGKTALFRLARSTKPEELELILLLFEHNADNTIVDSKGLTAVQAAQKECIAARFIQLAGSWLKSERVQPTYFNLLPKELRLNIAYLACRNN